MQLSYYQRLDRACILFSFYKYVTGCPAVTRLKLRYWLSHKKPSMVLDPHSCESMPPHPPPPLLMLCHDCFSHLNRVFCRGKPLNGQNQQLLLHVPSPLWHPPCGKTCVKRSGRLPLSWFPQTMYNCIIQVSFSTQAIKLHYIK